ncbi:MAG: SMP-30/gluconolactonase/LRE family protein [Chloroflexi bacterium]|nr:SMP-30/gluconolactonase/LRE family protein [Chloroflexota bacterium]
MTRNRYAWVLIVGLLLCVVPAFGQEITPEPTAEQTIEPGPPEITPEVTPETTPEATPEATSEATPETTPEATPEATPTATRAAGSGAEVEPLPDQVTILHEGLFPEGIEYDSLNGYFLVSSTSEGTVYRVDDDGNETPFVEDERIPSSLGLEIDEANSRLLVAATDMTREGYLGIYDLDTGEPIRWVDFGPLLPTDPERFVNDVAVDSQGNAYVTDSFAGVIYRVDPLGNAIVYLQHESFSTQFALNGIEYHPTGDYLLAVRGTDLIKIRLDNPADFTVVEIDHEFVGADGLLLLDDTTLVVVTNSPAHVYRLESDDDFDSAEITGEFEPGPVFPTTAAERSGEAYVLYAQLNAETDSVAEFPIQRVTFEAPAAG